MKAKMSQREFGRRVESVRPLFCCLEDRERTAQDIAACFFLDRSSPFLGRSPWGTRLMVFDPKTLLQRLIDGSRENRTSWDALVEIARGRLKIEIHSCGRDPVLALLETAGSSTPQRELLTDPLVEWIIDVLGDQLRDPRSRRRPRPRKSRRKTARDELICFVIWCLLEREDEREDEERLKPTRSGGGPSGCCAEGGSLCDIVGAAVNQELVDPEHTVLGYKNFERIWLAGQGQYVPSKDRESVD